MSANHNATVAAETTRRFPLGRTLITPAAQEAIRDAGQLPLEFLLRHQTGDWGDLCTEDKRENEFSVSRRLRILSKYHTREGEALYVITEADRSATTILLPSEY
jgi:hypothetical protein